MSNYEIDDSLKGPRYPVDTVVGIHFGLSGCDMHLLQLFIAVANIFLKMSAYHSQDWLLSDLTEMWHKTTVA